MRCPIHLMQFTAIELPIASYRSDAEYPSMSVYPSGNPCSRSHSTVENLRAPELLMITGRRCDLSVYAIFGINPSGRST